MPFTALNGHLPASVLVYLSWPEASNLRLRADAAASATRLAAAFRARFVRPLYVSDAYRTFEQQQALKIQKGSFAATPGTSNHGLGVALDLASNINVDNSAEHRWMEANGPAFGWTNPLWAVDFNPANGEHEPWHWEYDPAQDRHAHITLTPTPTHILAPNPTDSPQEDDMPILIFSGTHGWAALDGGRLLSIGDQATVDAAAAAGLKSWTVTDADFLRWLTHSDDTWLLYNPVNLGGHGWAVWSAGKATGIGDQAVIDQFKSNGVPVITVGASDFARFTA